MGDDDLEAILTFEGQVAHASKLWGPIVGEQMIARRELAQAREALRVATEAAEFARGDLEKAIIAADGLLTVTEIARLAGRSRRAIYDLINTIE